MFKLTELDRQIIRATQEGMELTPTPFHTLAERLGVPPEEVMTRMQALKEARVIRRIAAIPNHYRIGYAFNGMTVWNVEDAQVDSLGAQVGALPFVSHAYRRPRHLPVWPYNLFAMVHGKSREEVLEKASQIQALLGSFCHESEILFSERILKKTGFRMPKSAHSATTTASEGSSCSESPNL